MKVRSIIVIGAALAAVVGCSAEKEAVPTASPEQAAKLAPVYAFAQGDVERFLRELPPDDRAIQAYRALRWSPVPARSSTGVQGVVTEDITLTLDERSRDFIRDLFQLYEIGQITPEEMSTAVRTLDAVYASILSSHATLNESTVDQLHLSLTYAALDRAGLSQKASEIGLANPPVGHQGISALLTAARTRDYDQIDAVAP